MTDFNSLFSNLNLGNEELANMVGIVANGRNGLQRGPTLGMQDDKFHFKVAEFSMGSMAPKSDAYYEVSRFKGTVSGREFVEEEADQ